MSTYSADGLTIKGQVQRGYTIQASPATCYEFLSDTRTLLAQVPFVTKIQIGKTSGRARAFFNLSVLAFSVNAVLDIEPVRDPEKLTIQLKNAAEPLGPIPPGFYTCGFQCFIKIQPTERGFARASSNLVISLDATPLVARGLVSRSLVEMSGPTLVQDYCERLCDDYIINLLEAFRKWQAERARA